MGKNRSLMRRRRTMMDAVKLIYPDFAWDPSKFVLDTPASNAYWSNPDAQRKHLRIIEKHLRIGEVGDHIFFVSCPHKNPLFLLTVVGVVHSDQRYGEIGAQGIAAIEALFLCREDGDDSIS